MTIANKAYRPAPAPALFRLLSECALSRAALGACPIPLVMIDAKAKGRPITYANSAFEAEFGYPEAELVGRNLAALVFRGDASLLERLLGEASRRWELCAWAKDGIPKHVEVTLRALRDAEGELSHWVAVISDRGEVERLRAELQSLKQPRRAGATPTDERDADWHSALVLQQR